MSISIKSSLDEPAFCVVEGPFKKTVEIEFFAFSEWQNVKFMQFWIKQLNIGGSIWTLNFEIQFERIY